MVTAARERHGDVAGLSFDVADAARLPLDDASFDACRVDRVLQHIADPASAVREMVRVLRPGGVLVAYDNDWETLTVDCVDRELTRTVLNAVVRPLPFGLDRSPARPAVPAGRSPWCRHLPENAWCCANWVVADRIFSFLATAERLAEAGLISRSDANRWSDALRAADAQGRFFTSYTGFLVSGIRPDGA